jgi:hypothetical protein
MDGETISDLPAVYFQRHCQWRAATVDQLFVARNSDRMFTQMTLKRAHIVNAAEM